MRGDHFGQDAFKSYGDRLVNSKVLYRCRTRCKLATISRDDFAEVDRKVVMRKQQEFNKFIKSIPIFANYTNRQLKRFKDKFIKVNCIKDQVIYSEGQEANHAYIVVEGEFILTRQKPDNYDDDNEYK